MKAKACFWIFCAMMANFCHLDVKAQMAASPFDKPLSLFATETRQWLEGYAVNIGQNDFSYAGLRPDMTDCLLTRCTTGDMAIEWETQPVEVGMKEGAGFVWLAAIDITKEKHVFDVFINQVKRFQITSGNGMTWEITHPDGGRLRFVPAKNDPYWEAQGYMSLWVPASWLTPGKPVAIRMVGQKEDSNSWIIVYKAKDALSYLQKSWKCNTRAHVAISKKGEDYQLIINLPDAYIDQYLMIKSGARTQKIKVVGRDHQAEASLTIDKKSAHAPILISDDFGELLYLHSVVMAEGEHILIKDAVLNSTVTNKPDGSVVVQSIRSFMPQGYQSLTSLTRSKISDGNVLLMNSSHQDIAWMDAPEKCVIERDTMLLMPLYNRAIKDSTYRFDIEDALMLKEFIHRHPDKKEGITRLLKNGQISCGSTFIQPYEDMYSGEALARQFYLGARWLKQEFGYSPEIYWNPDVPGKTLQMPQIARKAGTPFMLISRFEKGVYRWYSPDGSFVTTYTPGHYSLDYPALHQDFSHASTYISKAVMSWDHYYQSPSAQSVCPLLSDWDMSAADDYTGLMNQWNGLKRIDTKHLTLSKLALPPIKLSLTPDFIRAFSKQADAVPAIKGERPDIWLYIHGPAHQKAIKASREGDILLTAAEKFATCNALIDGTFANYPDDQLLTAWESKIYPDHGWGGKHGDITDAFFADKYQFAKSEAEKVLLKSIRAIASKIDIPSGKGIPVVVFNSLSWRRSDPVSAVVGFDPSQAGSIQLADTKGMDLPVQLSDVVYYADGSIQSAKIHFIATDVPSVGYKTYYVKTSGEKDQLATNTFNGSFENPYYKVQFSNGGLSVIYDKELHKNIINAEKFNAGEVFTLRSVGTGAGEFADIQQPDMEGYDKAGNYKPNWKLAESGKVYSCFINRQPIKHAVVEERIIIYQDIKKIDFEIALLNYEGVLYREYRMALPVDMKEGQVSYEVPFGVVRVGVDEVAGAAGERHHTDCRDIHPRSIGNWIGIDNKDFGVTLSSSVAVADYIDPTGQSLNSQILQPLLLASRRSCHGEGNEYLQAGDHYFSFSLTSHQPGWENGYRFGCEANEKLLAVVDVSSFKTASLPEELSFFDVQNSNLVLSAIKKAEDNNGVAIRVYDLLGKPSELKLKCFKPLKEVSQTNLIEETLKTAPIRNGVIATPVGAYGIETMIVK